MHEKNTGVFVPTKFSGGEQLVGVTLPIKKLCKESNPVLMNWSIYDAYMEPPSSVSNILPLIGTGSDRNDALAKMKAIAEVVERYCFLSIPSSEIVWSQEVNSDSRFVAITDNHNSTDYRWWCTVIDYYSNESKLIPLEYVVPNIINNVKSPLMNIDSTGMAVHTSKRQAIINGVDECIERHCISRLWHEGATCQLTLQRGSKEISILLEMASRLNYENRMLIYQDSIDRIGCLSIMIYKYGGTQLPQLVCGSAGGKDFQAAVLAALSENIALLSDSISTYKSEDIELYNSSKDHRHYFIKENADTVVASLNIDTLPTIKFSALARQKFVVGQESTQEPLNKQVLVICRGNEFTEYLGLHVYQSLMPGIDRLNKHILRYDNLPFPLA